MIRTDHHKNVQLVQHVSVMSDSHTRISPHLRLQLISEINMSAENGVSPAARPPTQFVGWS